MHGAFALVRRAWCGDNTVKKISDLVINCLGLSLWCFSWSGFGEGHYVDNSRRATTFNVLIRIFILALFLGQNQHQQPPQFHVGLTACSWEIYSYACIQVHCVY